MKYHLGLGTNLGDREKNLKQCHLELQKLGIEILAASSIYETQPVGLKKQPWFLNQVLAIDADIQPERLLGVLKSLEKKMGRVPGPKYGPRVIDIDILMAEDLIIHTAKLKIPHPELEKRNFVLIPLTEIAATLIHPLQKITIAELTQESSDTSQVRKFELSS